MYNCYSRVAIVAAWIYSRTTIVAGYQIIPNLTARCALDIECACRKANEYHVNPLPDFSLNDRQGISA